MSGQKSRTTLGEGEWAAHRPSYLLQVAEDRALLKLSKPLVIALFACWLLKTRVALGIEWGKFSKSLLLNLLLVFAEETFHLSNYLLVLHR